MCRLNDGDQAALEALYDRYGSRLYSLALRITGDSDGAEEVLQDTFFQLWRKGTQFDPTRAPLIAWLITITRNRAISHIRLKARKMNRSLSANSASHRSDPTPSPLDDMIVQEIVSAALATLSGPTREVVLLAYFDGLTCEEIALRTNSPLGTTKTRLRSAMQSLKCFQTAAHSEIGKAVAPCPQESQMQTTAPRTQ